MIGRIIFLLVISVIFNLTTTTATAMAQRAKPQPGKKKPPAAAPVVTPKPAEPPVAPAPPVPEVIKPPATELSVEQLARLQVVIETSLGEIVFKFHPQAAANHARQFVWLIESGYFDGMSISRIIPNFIIQSGNSASWGEANPNQQRRFEIPKLKAEYDTNLKHERGAVSMARPNDEPDGGTTHFFICTRKASSLDNQYTVFGQVIGGIEIVDMIAAAPIAEGSQDKPRDRIEVKRIYIKALTSE
ncbi:MAG: peptidylprolyl isomerase [Acidobacteriota bacterium]